MNKGGRPPKYSPEQKAAALRMARENGDLGEVARETGIPRRTIASWIARGGVGDEASQPPKLTLVPALQTNGQTSGQTEAQRADALARPWLNDDTLTPAEKRALTRELMRADLLDQARKALARMDEPHIEYMATKDMVHRVDYPKATANAFRAYASAFSTLIKEYREEMHEPRRPVDVNTIVTTISGDVVRSDHERDILKRVVEIALATEAEPVPDTE